MPADDKRRQPWPRLAASAAVFRGDTVLLAERGKPPLRGLWSLPGGHVEPGERAREAARREVHEETSVVADIRGIVDIHDVIMRDEGGLLRVHYAIAVFYGVWLEGEPCAGSDCAQARFVPLDAVGGYKLTDGAAKLIARAAVLAEVA